MNHAVAEPVTRSSGSRMKSQGEIEAAVCDGISKFQQDFIGRGPRDIHSHLVGDLLVVRLQGVLTPAERQLIAPRGESAGAASAEAGHAPVDANGNGNGNGHSNGDGNGHAGDNENGRALLKQIRAHMVSAGRSRLAEIVEMLKAVLRQHSMARMLRRDKMVAGLNERPP